MRSQLRIFAIIVLLAAMAAILVGCERDRPAPTATGKTAVPAARSTVAASPSPAAARTLIVLPTVAGMPAGQATPIPATASSPTPPPPQVIVVQPTGQAGGTTTGASFTYTVVQGDTLASIASRFGISKDSIAAANTLANPDALTPGQVLKIPGEPPDNYGGATTYVVQSGDTLGTIARRFNTTAAAIQQLNNLTDPNKIYVGQKLRVPASGSTGTTSGATPAGERRTYIVQKGDTLLSIARKFGVTTQQLQTANNITNPDRIYPGQTLVVP